MLGRCNIFPKCKICRQYQISKTLYQSSSVDTHNFFRAYSQKLEARFKETDKEKILNVLNESDTDSLSRLSISKNRLKNLMKWRQRNGHFKSLADVGLLEGFSERIAEKLFESVLSDGNKEQSKETEKTAKIRGQVLSPALTESARKNIKKVVAVHVTVNAVSWCSVESETYQLEEWGLQDLSTTDDKRVLITDILQLARRAVQALPAGEAYVLEAPATSLRAAGGDPASPRQLTVNLQRAQLIAMMVALIDARSHQLYRNPGEIAVEQPSPTPVVYFLRPTLASRLYRTLVGNERVSSEQTVLALFSPPEQPELSAGRVLVPPSRRQYYLSQRDLEKEVLGQCLLLGLTFMEVCFYRNPVSIGKLARQNGRQ